MRPRDLLDYLAVLVRPEDPGPVARTSGRGLPSRGEMARSGDRLGRVRYLRREHAFVEWSSWVAALRER